jgi:hypothetical protein
MAAQRPIDVQTVWQNKKPQSIPMSKIHEVFCLHVNRENIQSETISEDGSSRAVHLATGTLDVFDHDTNSIKKTTLYGIAPRYVRFGDEVGALEPRRFCEVSLKEEKNVHFKRLVDQIYTQFEVSVREYVLGRIQKDIKVDSFSVDIDHLLDSSDTMRLGVTDMVWSQNVQADVVLSEDTFRSIGLYVGCAWIRLVVNDNKAEVRAGIKWYLSLRPKRRAVFYKRVIQVDDEESTQASEEEQKEKPADKKRRKRRREEETEEKKD